MSIIAIGNSKGGSGKTTTAVCLATAFAAKGLSVALLDADPDGRAGSWFSRWAAATEYQGTLARDTKSGLLLSAHCHRGITLVPAVNEDNLQDLADEAAAQNQMVLIDLQGSANQSMLLAFGMADLVVIPVQSSAFDLEGMVKAVKSVRSVGRTARRQIPHWVLLCRTATIPQGTRVDKFVRGEVEKLGLPVFGSELHLRTAFQRMTLDGLPPDKLADKGAWQDVEDLAREVALILQGKHPRHSAAGEVAHG